MVPPSQSMYVNQISSSPAKPSPCRGAMIARAVSGGLCRDVGACAHPRRLMKALGELHAVGAVVSKWHEREFGAVTTTASNTIGKHLGK